jgi:hypothetical protein
MFPILALFLSNEVYLCICDKNNINTTCNCKSFKSFIEADNYYKNHYYNQNYYNNNKHISTMISTEYIPHLLKKYYLNYNLSKLLLKCNLVK